MLSKKFQLVKSELETENFSLARDMLDSIQAENLSDTAKELHFALYSRLPAEKKPVLLESEESFTAKHLSDLDNQEIKPGISIVSCCMNRNENLLKAIKTWIKLPVDEIIIVDWSSNEPVSESIKDIEDKRIKILRVEGEPKWVLTYGFNVGLRFASYSRIYKFDADIEVSDNFIELNGFNAQQFVRGYWKSALDEGLDSQVYVNGSFGAYKAHLESIGYYNELIRTYGWDDSDLYERLASQCGLGTTYLNFRSVLHMEQEEQERTSNQDVINSDFLGSIKPTEFNNQRNKFIGRTTDYWSVERLQNYSIEQVTQQEWKLARLSESIHIPHYLIDDANIYAAIHFMWHRQHQLISKARSHTSFAKFIFEEYKAGINFESTLALLGKGQTSSQLICYDGTKPYSEFIKNCQTKNDKEQIFVLAIGDAFRHKRIGEYGGFVELIIMPKEFCDEVLHARHLEGLHTKNEGKLNFVDKNTFDAAFNQLFTPKVYVDAQHGLGNRIRAIGSAAAIAKKTNRELVIVWEADHHCECQFDDLFSYDGKVINKAFTKDAHRTMDVYNYMEVEDGACKDKLIAPDGQRHLYLRAAYTFNSPLSDWESENEFIRSLEPTKEILKMVENFEMKSSIAAHVRMEAGAGLDHNTYDSVENWTQEGHDQLHFWREKSHYSHFIKRIDELFAQDQNAKIFLATDMPETYKVFEEYYGERLVYLKREVYDRSKEQIKYALADAILLSKAQKLLGSTWSSFSELAMRLSTTYSEIEMSGRDF